MRYITKIVAAAVAAVAVVVALERLRTFLTFVFLSLHQILIFYQLYQINFLGRRTELILTIHCFEFTKVNTEKKIGFHQTLQGRAD